MKNRNYRALPPLNIQSISIRINNHNLNERLNNVLSTLRLELEPILASHADELFEGLSQKEAYAFIPDEPPNDLYALNEHYQKLSRRTSPDGSEAWLNWAIRIKNSMALGGYVQATVKLIENYALIAYHVIPPCWRQGIGKEAVAGMLQFLFDEYEITHIEAHIDTRNIASIALVTSLGFGMIRHVEHADSFKDSTSHENHYGLNRQNWKAHSVSFSQPIEPSGHSPR